MPMLLKLTNGNVLCFDAFRPKKQNIVKLLLHNNYVDKEGVFCCLNDADKRDYDADVSDDTIHRVAILLNTSIHFEPQNSYGWCIPIVLCGHFRPESDISWLDERNELCIIEPTTAELRT